MPVETFQLTLLLIAVAIGVAILVLLAFLCAGLRRQEQLEKEEAERTLDAADAMMEGVQAAKRDILSGVAQSDARLTQAMANLINFSGESQNRSTESVNRFTAAAQAELKAMNDKIAQEFRALQGLLDERLARILETNAANTEAMNGRLSQSLEVMRKDNAEKLEAMRATVQEKLEKTLADRLQMSFRVVDEKLGLVQTGLGEMRRMAESVAKLQGVLSNVKTRGMFGETQLSALLSEILSPCQYGEQVRLIPDANVVVDFAVKLPGRDKYAPCWLPIDAKFPLEDWESLEDARRESDAARAAEASKALERAVLKQAKSIREKYVRPPFTTEFAVMFLPAEGLYAEVIQMPGLLDRLQREMRVTPAGPVIMSALLNSLMMGFMTLAMEKRSADVWKLLGEVKAEFASFAKQFALVEKKFREAQSSLEAMNTRTRMLDKRMRAIDAVTDELPFEEGAAANAIEAALTPALSEESGRAEDRLVGDEAC